MTIIKQQKSEIYDNWGQISRPVEEIIFLILRLEEMLEENKELTEFDFEFLRIQNMLMINNCFSYIKMGELLRIPSKIVQGFEKRITYKLLILYLQGKIDNQNCI